MGFFTRLLGLEPAVSLYAIWDAASPSKRIYVRESLGDDKVIVPLFTARLDAEEYLAAVEGDMAEIDWRVEPLRGPMAFERFSKDMLRYTIATHYAVNPPAYGDALHRMPLEVLPGAAKEVQRLKLI